MATFTRLDEPKYIKTQDLLNDNLLNQITAKKNIGHLGKINVVTWRNAQLDRYNNLLKVTIDRDLGYTLGEENQQQQSNFQQIQYQAFRLLLSFANDDIAEYIVKSLTIDELLFMNQYFTSLIQDFKKGNKGNKEDFITYVRKRFNNIARSSSQDAGTRNVFVSNKNTETETEEVATTPLSSINNNSTSDYIKPPKPLYPPPLPDNTTNNPITLDFEEETASDNDNYFDASEGEEMDTEPYVNIPDPMVERVNASDNATGAYTYNLPPNELQPAVFKRKKDISIDVEAIIGIKRKGTTTRSGKKRMDNFEEIRFLIQKEEAEEEARRITEQAIRQKDRAKREEEVRNFESPARQAFTGRYNLRKRPIYGRGFSLNTHMGEVNTGRTHRFYKYKFYIDLKKLANNILCVKYALNDLTNPRLKPLHISNEVKNIIYDILANRFNNRLYNQLQNVGEKRLIKKLVEICKFDIEIDDESDKEFQKNYEILLGEWKAGNNSPEVKNALKRYVIEAYNENKVPKNQAMMLLYELSL